MNNSILRLLSVFLLIIWMTTTITSAGVIDVKSFSLNKLLHFGMGYNTLFKRTPNENKAVNLNNKEDHITVLRMGFNSLAQSVEDLTTGIPDSVDKAKAEILGPAVCFPNPFRQEDSTSIGYKLSKNMDITLHLYDMFANLIIEKSFLSGTMGGRSGFNEVAINETTLDGYFLSAGVYFFLISHDSDVLARGKMAVVP